MMPQISASKRFIELPHPADAALLIFGETIEALFVNAAEGLYHIMGAVPLIALGSSRAMNVQGLDNESRLVAFLSELIYLADLDVMATGFSINFAVENLVAHFVPFSIKVKSRLIKAVTYNQMKISYIDHKFQTKIVMDL